MRYDESFKEAAMELLALLWSHLGGQERQDLFTWRYEKNPFSIDPHIYLARYNGQLIGFKSFVEQRFRMGQDRPVRAFTPSDAIVHPAFRRKGVSSSLSKEFFERAGSLPTGEAVVFNLSSNALSTPGNLKLGWQSTSGKKHFVLRTSPGHYLPARSKGRHWPLESTGLSAPSGKQVVIAPLPRADEMSQLAYNSRKPGILVNERSREYYHWRYALQPEKYLFAFLYDGGEMDAFAVIRRVSNTQYLLWEYACGEPNSLRELTGVVVNACKIPFLRSWALSADDARLLKSCGFWSIPGKLRRLLGKEGLPVLVRPTSLDASSHDFFLAGKDIRDINNWQFFLADRH